MTVRICFLEVPAMRLDITQLLREPIGTHVSVEFDVGFQRLSDDLSVEAVKGTLTLYRVSEGVLARGVLSVNVELECGRCLNPTLQALEIEMDERFVLSPQDVSEEEGTFPIGADHHLDLRPALRDLVIVSTPMHILCRPDCPGLCPVCGEDLNEGPCGCEPDDVDPRLAALKALLEGNGVEE
jgi:uncharacterized protein